MNDEINIQLCFSDNAFKEYHIAVYGQVNVIITTYNTASKCSNTNGDGIFY